MKIKLNQAYEEQYRNHFKKDLLVEPTTTVSSATFNEKPSPSKGEEINSAPSSNGADSEAVYDYRTGSNLMRIAQRGHACSLVSPWALVDDVPDALNGSSRLYESDVADLLLVCFNHLHASDTFYPGQEPFPGTVECRFCHETFKDWAHDWHAKACQRQHLLNQLSQDVREAVKPLDRCPWIDEDGNMCKYEYCGEAGAQRACHQHYMLTHGRPFTADNESCPQFPDARLCRIGKCAESDQLVVLASLNNLREHMIVSHFTIFSRSYQSVDNIFYWCFLCACWMSIYDCSSKNHMATHSALVNDILKTECYIGIKLGKSF